MNNDLFKAPRSVFTGTEFRALPVRAKLLYLAVCAHPGLSECGVGRWDEDTAAMLCPDLTFRECMEAAFELFAAGLIVFDPVAGLIGPRGFLSWVDLGRSRVANHTVAKFYDTSSPIVVLSLAVDAACWAVDNSNKSTFTQVKAGLCDLVDRLEPDNLVRRLTDLMSLLQESFMTHARFVSEKAGTSDLVYKLLNNEIVGISTFSGCDEEVYNRLLTKLEKSVIILNYIIKDDGYNYYIDTDDTYTNRYKADNSKDGILAFSKPTINKLVSKKPTIKGKKCDKPHLQLVSNTEPVDNLPLPVENFSGTKRAAYSAEFEQFWAAFPKARRVGKKGAYAKWQQVLRKGEATFEEIMEGLERYKAGWNPAYYHMPTTWLNKGLWDGEYQPNQQRSTMQRFAAIAMQAVEEENNNTQWEEQDNEF